MKMGKDYYDVLQVDRDASMEEIKKSFKRLAMKYHPDKKNGDAEKFKEINEAYAILSDPNKKMMYDRFGVAEGGDMPMSGMHEMNVENIFENLFGFHMGGPKKRKKPSPKTYELPVTLEEVYKGKPIAFRISKKIFKGDAQSCMKCHGRGQVMQQINMGFIVTQNVSICPDCQGNGKTFDEKNARVVESEIEVPLPVGVPNGNHIIVENKGDEFPGMDPGDVHFVVIYQPHPHFRMKEPLDVEMDITINLLEALYGFRRVIPTLGEEKIEIFMPPRTCLSQKLDGPVHKVIHGEGMCFQGHRGDLIMNISIELPHPQAKGLREVLEHAFPESYKNESLGDSTTRLIDLQSL